MSTLLIRNGRVISPGDSLDARLDALIRDGVIQDIAPKIAKGADEILDVDGQIVAPGFVDLHVHFREPGFEASETLATGLAAAVAGGFTSVCPMPNTRPVNDNPEATRAMIEKAWRFGLARVFPIAAVSVGSQGDELTDFRELLDAGAVAFSDDGRPVKTAGLMRRALETARAIDAAIIDHCEEPSLSAGGAINEGTVAQALGIKGIPCSSEEVCVARDVVLAAHAGARLHVAHLSTAGAVEMVHAAKRRGVQVTCEVAPHHFVLTDEAVREHGALAKMNPPLRSKNDLDAVRAGIASGWVDAIATDHAPHAAELKEKPLSEAAFGITGLETVLGLAITHLVEKGLIALPRLVALMSTQPARIIRQHVTQSLGRLQTGGTADVTVFDPRREWTYHAAAGRSKSHNTPFDGFRLKGLVTATIVGGRIVYRAEP